MRKQLGRTFAVFCLLSCLTAALARADDKSLNVQGYLQTMYAAPSNSTADSFSMRLARVVFSGKANQDWSYVFQLDATTSPSLLDGYVDYSKDNVLPAPLAFRLRAGQFKVPFSMESLMSDTELDTVNRSQVVNALVPGRDTGTKGRDIGADVQLTASPWNMKKLVEATVGEFNGEGANYPDKNTQKSFAGRMVLNPSDHFSFGSSYYGGRRGKPSGLAERMGWEASAMYGQSYLKSEYIRARNSAIEEEGWYVQAASFVIPKVLQAVAKYDVLDPNTRKSGDKTAVIMAGGNWYFAQNMRIQVNYEWKYNEQSVMLCNTFYGVLALTF